MVPRVSGRRDGPVSRLTSLLAIFGILTLAYGAYGWTAFWWGLAAAHGSLGFWELTIARSTAPRT